MMGFSSGLGVRCFRSLIWGTNSGIPLGEPEILFLQLCNIGVRQLGIMLLISNGENIV
jgi:hypothetical protein